MHLTVSTFLLTCSDLDAHLSQTARRSTKVIHPTDPTQSATPPQPTRLSQLAEPSSSARSFQAKPVTSSSESSERHRHSNILDESQEHWTNKVFPESRLAPPGPESRPVLPPSTGQILPKPSGYGILTPMLPNPQFQRITIGDLAPSNSHSSQQPITPEYNRAHDGDWSVAEPQFSQDLRATYPAVTLAHPHHPVQERSATTAIATSTQVTSNLDPFINFSPHDIAQKGQKHSRDEERVPKRQRSGALPQPMASNHSAGPINSTPPWDEISVGGQTGAFGTSQVPLFPGSGSLPLAIYPPGMSISEHCGRSLIQIADNHYSQMWNIMGNFNEWDDLTRS